MAGQTLLPGFMELDFIVKIDGVKEWERVAKRLPETIVLRVARKAVSKGMAIFRNDIKRRAPGSLKRHVATKIKTYAQDNVVFGVTGARTPGYAPHFYLVEMGHRMVLGGTVPRIGLRAGSVPRAKRAGRTGKGRVVGHVPPHPFVRPAEDANKTAALAVAETTLFRETKNEMNKLLRVK